MTIVGLKLRKIRELRGFSQEYVAQQINISQKAYSKIECGSTKLTNQKLHKILEVLEISEYEFHTFDEISVLDKISKSKNADNSKIRTQSLLLKQCQDRVNYLEKENLFLRNLVGK